MVRFFDRVRIIRYQAEGIQVGCDSFQHTDHPRSVESNKLRFDIFIGPKIHNHVFPTLKSLQPISAASQHLDFSRQAGSDLGFRLRRFSFFLAQIPLDCRNWLSQTEISLASGALRSWWIRLELSPVAPAILRIDRPA